MQRPQTRVRASSKILGKRSAMRSGVDSMFAHLATTEFVPLLPQDG